MTTHAPGNTGERLQTPSDLVTIGHIDYGDERFSVNVGRDAQLVGDIIEGAKEPFMQRMVPKDSKERFADPEAFEKWYAKDRFLVSAYDSKGKRAAIVWYGPSSLQAELDGLGGKGADIDFGAPEGSDHTFAIRIYEEHRDKERPEDAEMSFARLLMGVSQSLYEEDRAAKGTPVDGVWLETNLYEYDSDNNQQDNGAVFLYRKAGYQDVGTYINPDPTNPEDRVVMVAPPRRDEMLAATALESLVRY